MLTKNQLKEYKRLLKLLFEIKEEATNGNDMMMAFFDDCAALAYSLSVESNLRDDHKEQFRLSDPDIGIIDYVLKELSGMTVHLKAFQEENFALDRKMSTCMTDFMDFKNAITAEDASRNFIDTSTITMDKRLSELQNEIRSKVVELDKYRKPFYEHRATYNSFKN